MLHILAAHAAGKRLVLHLLYDRLGGEIVDTGRAHQRSGRDQSGDLVTSEEVFVEIGFGGRVREIATVREDGVENFFGIPALPQLIDGAQWMLVGMLFPIQVVQQSSKA